MKLGIDVFFKVFERELAPLAAVQVESLRKSEEVTIYKIRQSLHQKADSMLIGASRSASRELEEGACPPLVYPACWYQAQGSQLHHLYISENILSEKDLPLVKHTHILEII